jgi:hypothetical protein
MIKRALTVAAAVFHQTEMGETEAQASNTPQLFKWAAAQLAIKHGVAPSPTP